MIHIDALSRAPVGTNEPQSDKAISGKVPGLCCDVRSSLTSGYMLSSGQEDCP